MEIFIGIDQSINSTGVCLKIYNNDLLVKEHFYIITNKVTKKAFSYSETLNNFSYILYNKYEKNDSDDNTQFEMNKLFNNIMITDNILSIINQNIELSNFDAQYDKIFIAMEGISYQSSQTKSLLDLSGLSTLIRYRIYNFFKDYKGNLHIFTPSEIKKFASGNGNCSKDVMIGLFKTSYKEISQLPKIDDIADAYWICTYLKEIHN